MIPDRIEYLLMLARDERTENDDLIDKQNQIFAQRALRLLQLEQMHEETGRILQEELKRFARWMPKESRQESRQESRPLPSYAEAQARAQGQVQAQETMPRVVRPGPMPQVNPQGGLAIKEK